jgi:hypothetical protein
VELRPATAEARLVELAVLRAFAALSGGMDCQEGARHGPKKDSWGG